MRIFARGIIVVVAATFTVATVETWSPQGHRLVSLVASNHLTAAARANVRWLLDDATLADVAVWADGHIEANSQTGPWHYVNVPLDATGYDRERDCPRQPRVGVGGRGDQWRDCIVDRILHHEERLGDSSLDRADRAVALKFLVHLVGDVHQPFHAIGVERGGNGIAVSVFGATTCAHEDGSPYACHLHGTWDTALVAHRRLSDEQYLAELERLITRRGWSPGAAGGPAAWAMESHGIAKSALVSPNDAVGEEYFRAHIGHVDERLARAGLRLAALLNQTLVELPPP